MSKTKFVVILAILVAGCNVIWSPDSTQLILPRQSEPFIVIDLERGAAEQIVQDANLRSVGWLVNPSGNAVTATSTPTP
jgi:hypothetical protein